MTPRTEHGESALVAEQAGDEAGLRARRHGLLTRRGEWLMIGGCGPVLWGRVHGPALWHRVSRRWRPPCNKFCPFAGDAKHARSLRDPIANVPHPGPLTGPRPLGTTA